MFAGSVGYPTNGMDTSGELCLKLLSMKAMLIIVLSITISAVSAQNEALRTKHFNIDKNGLALEGYDPVSYFEGKPAKGTSKIQYRYLGILYYFATNAHLEAFKKEPAKYEPQYGGYCAFAMGDYAEKVSVDPETYKILEGKLYLFYNAFFTNTLPKWNANEAKLKPAADANWAKIYKP